MGVKKTKTRNYGKSNSDEIFKTMNAILKRYKLIDNEDLDKKRTFSFVFYVLYL